MATASPKAVSAAGGLPLFLPSRLPEGPGKGLPARQKKAGPRLPTRPQTPTRLSPQAGEETKAAPTRKAASAAGGLSLFLPSRLREGPGEGLPARQKQAGPRPPLRPQTPTWPPPQAGEETKAAASRKAASAAGGLPLFLPARLPEGPGEGLPARQKQAGPHPPPRQPPSRPPPQAGEETKAVASPKAVSAAGGLPPVLPSRLPEGLGEGLPARQKQAGPRPPLRQQTPT